MHECIYSFLEHMFNFHVRNLPQEQPTVIHKRTPTRMNFVHISMKTNYKKCIQFKREQTKSIEDARDNPSPIQHTTLLASPICEKIHLPNSPNFKPPFFSFSFFNIPQSCGLNHFKRSFGASGAAFGKNAAQTGRWSCVCVKRSSNTTLKLRFCQTQLQNTAPCSVFCSEY